MGKINIKVADEQLAKKLAALEHAATDAQPLYAAIGSTLLNRIRLCFKMGVDPWGAPWVAIKFRAPAVQKVVGKYGGTMDRRDKAGNLIYTAKGKGQMAANKEGKAGHPLRDKGLLQRSITSQASADGVVIGTNLRQAKIHQFGGTIKPKRKKVLVFPGPDGELIFAKKVTIPARPYLPLRRFGEAVDLPPAWSLLVTNSIKAHLRKAFEMAEA